MQIVLGEGAHFLCHTYPNDPESGPILVIDTSGVTFRLTNRVRGGVEVGDVRNARRLLEVVSRFVAEVERLHAQSSERAESAAESAA
ncbi:hypothetical protein GCM10010191_90540 [Actinomadura vinacea]|uniref:DUF5753 domain-containing protein n=2 Tax=Actinomadura vinacea TaxID=115336 RepID=A0ABN3KDP4_9ACTN